MVSLFGVTWWDQLVGPHLKTVWDTHRKRQKDYKRDVPQFKNVVDNLLSIDTGDLWSILTLKVKRWNPVYDPKIENAIRDGKANSVLQQLAHNQMEVVLDLWDRYFKSCFDPKFKSEWDTFIRNRNHIAHNKLVDRAAYNKILNNMEAVYRMIEEAEKKFFRVYPSEEEKRDLFELANEPSLQELAVQEMIEESTGVTVYDAMYITEQFKEVVDEFKATLEDRLYFRSDLNVETKEIEEIDLVKGSEFFTISSKVKKKNVIHLQCDAEVNDDRGGTSEMVLELRIDDEVVDECRVTFTNGDYEFDEDLGYVPVTKDSMDKSQIEVFTDSVLKWIDKTFPNLVEKAKNMAYLAAKDGAESPVAEFPCSECGEMTVSTDPELWTVGSCVSCGSVHNLQKCTRCERYYDADSEGSDGFCDACFSYIEEQ
jgi:hypothetical protein